MSDQHDLQNYIPGGNALARTPPTPTPNLTQTSSNAQELIPTNSGGVLATSAALVEPRVQPSSTPLNALGQKRSRSSPNQNESNKNRRLSNSEDTDTDEESMPETDDAPPNVEELFEGTTSMDKLNQVIVSLIRGKKAPTTTQVNNLQTFAKSVTDSIARLQYELILLKGQYKEQAKTIKHLQQNRGIQSTEFTQTLEQIQTTQKELIKAVNQISERPAPITYASTAARVPTNPRIPTTTKVVLVYPKEGQQLTSEETKLELNKLVNPREMNLQISRVSNIRNGGLALQINPNQEKGLRAKLDQVFITRQPKPNKPKYKIYDIPGDLNVETLQEAIHQQNFRNTLTLEQFKTNFIPLFKMGPRNDTTTQWVVEMGKIVREAMSSPDRIYIEWQACKIKQYTIITRCYKCHRFGHSSKVCNAVASTCGHCAKEGHAFNDCPDKKWQYKCINCIRAKCTNIKYDVSSSDCPIYRKELALVQNKIDYDQ